MKENENKPVALTANKVVVLRALENGPQKWSVLRKAYFGEARAKEQASTSFYTQLKSLEGKGLIKKENGLYAITAVGAVSIKAIRDSGFDVDGTITEAQRRFEAANPIAKPAIEVEAEAEVA